MGSLLTYSGLTTKVRSMKSRLLTEGQYRELAGFDTVSSGGKNVIYFWERG